MMTKWQCILFGEDLPYTWIMWYQGFPRVGYTPQRQLEVRRSSKSEWWHAVPEGPRNLPWENARFKSSNRLHANMLPKRFSSLPLLCCR